MAVKNKMFSGFFAWEKKKITRHESTLTHAILERRHDLHALPGYPQLVGINIVGGATLLGLFTIRLHGRAAILSVKGHTYHRGEVGLSKAETEQDKIYVRTHSHTPWFTDINPIPNIE